MTQPFEGPHDGPQPEGLGAFGFDPFDPRARRAFVKAQRDARRHWRDLAKDQARAQAAAFRGAPFGPGLEFVIPGVPHPGRRGGGPRGRARGRTRRGDVRAAILALLAERPMHGYEMIQEIGERSNGIWRPSPGSVYPTLQLLVDEGLIVATESEGSKRLFELTDEGREAASKTHTPPWEEIAEGADPNEVTLRAAFHQLAGAIFQASCGATSDQQTRIVDIVNKARRDIYGVLGEAE